MGTFFSFGSAGNIVGRLLGYVVNREWKERVLHVRPEKMERATLLADRQGTVTAFWGWHPMLGSALLTTLGMMRSNVMGTLLSVSAGKMLRYLVIILPYPGIMMLIH